MSRKISSPANGNVETFPNPNPRTIEDDTLLSIREVASTPGLEFVSGKVGPSTLYRAQTPSDGGPPLRVVRIGKKVYVTPRLLRAWIAERSAWTAPPRTRSKKAG